MYQFFANVNATEGIILLYNFTVTSDSNSEFHWSRVTHCSMTQLSLVDKRLIVSTRCLRNCNEPKKNTLGEHTNLTSNVTREQKLYFERQGGRSCLHSDIVLILNNSFFCLTLWATRK